MPIDVENAVTLPCRTCQAVAFTNMPTQAETSVLQYWGARSDSLFTTQSRVEMSNRQQHYEKLHSKSSEYLWSGYFKV